MRWTIYGINNSSYYDVRACDVAFNAADKNEIVKAYRKEFDLVQIDRESKTGNLVKQEFFKYKRGF